MIFKFKVFKVDEEGSSYYDFYTAMASTKDKARKIISKEHGIDEKDLEDDINTGV